MNHLFRCSIFLFALLTLSANSLFAFDLENCKDCVINIALEDYPDKEDIQDSNFKQHYAIPCFDILEYEGLKWGGDFSYESFGPFLLGKKIIQIKRSRRTVQAARLDSLPDGAGHLFLFASRWFLSRREIPYKGSLEPVVSRSERQHRGVFCHWLYEVLLFELSNKWRQHELYEYGNHFRTRENLTQGIRFEFTDKSHYKEVFSIVRRLF